MHPTKASALSYKNYWHIMGNSVTSAVLQVLNTGIFPKDLNHTFIILVSKKVKAVKVVDFKPIILCNAFYKLIAKVIENRLKVLFASKDYF